MDRIKRSAFCTLTEFPKLNSEVVFALSLPLRIWTRAGEGGVMGIEHTHSITHIWPRRQLPEFEFSKRGDPWGLFEAQFRNDVCSH